MTYILLLFQPAVCVPCPIAYLPGVLLKSLWLCVMFLLPCRLSLLMDIQLVPIVLMLYCWIVLPMYMLITVLNQLT